MRKHVCRTIQEAGGTPYYVGGMVRDILLGLKPSDCDVEVFGLAEEKLLEVLQRFGEVTLAGKSFGVYKLHPRNSSDTIDVSLPRREYKTAEGHTGFSVKPDPTMSFAEAAYRRDFTINAMGMNPFTGEVVDPYGGQQDLSLGSLIAVSEKFKEDPLRVLRGMQFAGRFDFSMEGAYWTTQYCKELIPAAGELPPERVFGEWYKWASLSKRPSAGLAFLRDAGWFQVYPALLAMSFCPQDPECHPEGDCMVHTMHVCDAMATICDREGIDGEERATLVLGALCHDLGKPATTSFTEGRWRSPGHAQAGVDVSRDFLDSIGCFPRIRDRILPLVREHMIHINGDINMRMVRRLTMRLGTAQFSHLIHVMEADYSGRPPLRAGIPEGAAKLAELRASLPLKYEGIVLGRHLMEFGLTPGPGFGPILRAALEAQLEGEFDSPETGIEWLQLRSII